jgi:hypothetical protein
VCACGRGCWAKAGAVVVCVECVCVGQSDGIIGLLHTTTAAAAAARRIDRKASISQAAAADFSADTPTHTRSRTPRSSILGRHCTHVSPRRVPQTRLEHARACSEGGGGAPLRASCFDLVRLKKEGRCCSSKEPQPSPSSPPQSTRARVRAQWTLLGWCPGAARTLDRRCVCRSPRPSPLAEKSCARGSGPSTMTTRPK